MNIVVFGDSVTEGAWASSVPNRWPSLLAGRLRAALGRPVSAARYYPANNYLSQPSEWVYVNPGANFSLSGLGTHTVQLLSGATATLSFAGTGFDLHYSRGIGSGHFTYQVDGGASVPIDSSVLKSFYSDRISITGLTPGSHTIVVTGTAGVSYLEGLYAYDDDQTTGLHVYNGGVAGWRLYDYAATAIPYSNHQESIRNADADLVLFACGLNEYGSTSIQRTRAQVAEDIRSTISMVRSVDPTLPVFFIIPHEREVELPADGSWAAWRSMFMTTAGIYGAGIIDVGTALGSFVGGGNPHDSGDKLHLNNLGMSREAEQVATQVLQLARGTELLPGVNLGVGIALDTSPWTPNGCTVTPTGETLADGSPAYTVQDANSEAGVAPICTVSLVVGKRYRAEVMLKQAATVVTAGTVVAALQVYNTDFSGYQAIGYSAVTSATTVQVGGLGGQMDCFTSLDPENPGWRRMQIEFVATYSSVYLLIFPCLGALTDLSTITVARPRVTRIYA